MQNIFFSYVESEQSEPRGHSQSSITALVENQMGIEATFTVLFLIERNTLYYEVLVSIFVQPILCISVPQYHLETLPLLTGKVEKALEYRDGWQLQCTISVRSTGLYNIKDFTLGFIMNCILRSS